MGRKIKQAKKIIATGKFILPSPDDILAAMTENGAWTASTLAKWGIKWPPQKGWRFDLENRWREANGMEKLVRHPVERRSADTRVLDLEKQVAELKAEISRLEVELSAAYDDNPRYGETRLIANNGRSAKEETQ